MVHLGRNIARIRGMRLQTQKQVAGKLNLTQPEYSRIEQRDQIDEDLLERVAAALDVTPELIKEFREEAVFTNNIYDQNNHINQVYFQFNPLEKIVALYEQIVKDKDEIIEMYKKQQKAS